MSREFPTVIAVALQEYEGEQQPFRKLHRLVDVFETIIKYAAIIAIQDFYRAGLDADYAEVSQKIRADLPRAALGKWLGFLREAMRAFENHQHALFSPELYHFAKRISQGDLRSSVDEFLALRNNYVGHGATMPDSEARLLVQQRDPDLRRLLQAAEFLTDIPLLYVESQTEERTYQVKPLIGAGYLEAPSQSLYLALGQLSLPVNHVILHNPAQNTYLDLHPLLVFTECNDTLGGKLCGQRKIAFLNQLRDEKRIEFLDYWLGHHSRFKAPHPLPTEFLRRFPRPQRTAGTADWFEEFISNRTAHFVGREAELEQLSRFAEHSAKNALLIVGAPGIGKSTLLAKWADEHNAPRHFIREGDVQTYDPVAVFRNLALQISQKFNTEWHAPLQADPALYRDELTQLLRRVATNNPVVLIIDGLDEAIRSRVAERGTEHSQTLVDWLPDPVLLPNGVRLILSMRPELLEHPALTAKFGQDKAEYLHLSPLSDNEVRALLFQVRSKYEVLDRDDYVQAVVERSEGNPLYLKMLVEDIVERRITFGQIDQLPQGVVAYFERMLEFIEREGRAREAPDIETILKEKRKTLEELMHQGILTSEQVEAQLQRERAALESRAGVKSTEMLALFCLAKAPLSLEEASAILNALREEVHRAFEVIRTVLTGDEQGRFTLFHSAFQDYFLHLDRYTDSRFHRHTETINNARERLLAYCARWQEHRSPYALRHYAEHLLETSDYNALYALARNEVFAQAQTEVLPEDPDLPLKTIRLGLDAAIGQERPELMAEMILRHAERVEQAETPLNALRNGNVDRAISLAKLPKWEIEAQTCWLLLLSWSLYNSGDRQAAECCLDEIISLYRHQPNLRDYYVKVIKLMLEAIAELPTTSTVNKLLTDDSSADLACFGGSTSLWNLGKHTTDGMKVVRCEEIARQGKVELAQTVACTLLDPYFRSIALARVACAAAERGQLQQAEKLFTQSVEVARTISYLPDCASSLIEVATAMARVSIIEHAQLVASHALNTMCSIREPIYRLRLLEEAAMMWSACGLTEKAQEAIECIILAASSFTQSQEKLQAIISIAEAAAQSGHGVENLLEHAIALAKELENSQQIGGDEAIIDLAIAITRMNMVEKALEFLEELSEPSSQLWGKSAVAAVLTQQSQTEYAYELLSNTENPAIKDQILLCLVSALSLNAEFDEALRCSELIQDVVSKSKALAKIATEMRRTGQFEKSEALWKEAEQILEPIEDEFTYRRSGGLAVLAVASAQAGRFDEAIKIAVRVRRGFPGYAEAIAGIAKAYAQHGDPDAAMRILSLIDSPMVDETDLRLRAYLELVPIIVHLGYSEIAERILHEVWYGITSDIHAFTSLLLWEAAETAVDAQKYDIALDYAQKITSKCSQKIPILLRKFIEHEQYKAVAFLLPLCIWTTPAALHAIAGLIRLYPNHAKQLTESVLDYLKR